MNKIRFSAILLIALLPSSILYISGCAPTSQKISTQTLLVERNSLTMSALEGDCDDINADVWKEDLNSFLDSYRRDIVQFQNQAKKKKNNSNILTIIGTAIGLTGGVVGIADSDSEAKVAEITSLTTAALTSTVGIVDSGVKSEKLSDCAQEIKTALDEFVAKWPITAVPRNCKEADEYKEDRVNLAKRITEANDCTTPSAQKVFSSQ
ncbi:MAG: hypothetical protein R8P61_28245 [Bacteroidia bacterium]|nr:hypothetical protein [Bacteroidia bacterium]